MNVAQEFVTLTEAAVILRLPYHTVRELMMRGELGEPTHMGRGWFLDAERVKAYALEHPAQKIKP